MCSNFIYYDSFDEIFYNENYKISEKKLSKETLFKHWLNHGRKLDYVINVEQLKDRVSLNLNYNNDLIKITDFKQDVKVEFNILIRTSERPNFFKKCVDSIFNQKYKGKINIYVSCDTYETYEYVKKYDKIKYIFIEKKKIL